MHRVIIGLVGHPSCGKDTVAEYLVEKYGFTHVSLGDLIRKHVTENNLGNLDRDTLFRVGNELRTKNGPGVLDQMALDTPSDKLVISGCRAIAETEAVKQNGGRIIFITTPIESRYQRALSRGRVGENISLEEFKKNEDREGLSSDPNAQNVGASAALADYTIVNDGTLEDLYTQVDKIVLQLLNA